MTDQEIQELIKREAKQVADDRVREHTTRVESWVKIWGGVGGAINLLAVLVAVFYIFFTIPNKVAGDVANEVTRNPEVRAIVKDALSARGVLDNLKSDLERDRDFMKNFHLDLDAFKKNGHVDFVAAQTEIQNALQMLKQNKDPRVEQLRKEVLNVISATREVAEQAAAGIWDVDSKNRAERTRLLRQASTRLNDIAAALEK